MRNFRKILYVWLEERVPLQDIGHFFAKKRVPQHLHTLWYYLGGITLFLFCIQVVTGILLLLYYRPTAEGAFESVQFIMTQVRFGWLIRSIHSWCANLLILSAFVHMFSAFLMKAYRKPRELTWITGFFLLVLAMGFGFSGYLLPWNELAFFATRVGTDIAGVIPFAGKFLLTFLRGGDDVTGATLTRFFGFHVAVLPVLAMTFLALHLILIQIQGMSVPPSIEKSPKRKPDMPFFPNFVLRDIIGWLLALFLLTAMASLFPWELGRKADPFASAPVGIKPEWYFMFMFQTLKYIPSKILFLEGEVVGIFAFGLGAFLGLLIPFLDRRSARGEKSRLFTAIGIAVIAYIVVFTLLAVFVKAT